MLRKLRLKQKTGFLIKKACMQYQNKFNFKNEWIKY